MGGIHLVVMLGTMLVLMPPPVAGCGRGAMYINKNGYNQMVVAIGEDVPESSRLVDRIKEVFTAASERLYQATRKRAYLADIKILLPSSWTHKAEYQTAGREQIDSSDIVISSFNNSAGWRQEGIFVLKGTDCGEPGHFMHISPSLLLDAKASEVYGPLDKVLVHEFAHLRYGVFDEHPTGDDPLFYHSPNGEVEATRCSRAITGTMYDEKTKSDMCKAKGNLPDENCRFRDEDGKKDMKEFGSLMYRPYLSHVDEFCDSSSGKESNLHNPFAPNAHNRRCNGRSVWQVILSHNDFTNSNNLPRQVSNTVPQFTLLHTARKRYVLILDLSGKDTIRSACSNFLLNMVREGDKVGIVWIHARALRAAELTVINEQNRMILVNKLPRQTSPFSTIGGGVKEAINMLQQDGGNAAGGHIIVITTKEEDKNPTLIDAGRDVFRAKVIIHAIAYGDGASSRSDTIARMTGGHSFLVNNIRTTLDEALSAISELNQNIRDRRFLIMADSMIAPQRTPKITPVYIDSTLGANTQFSFTYSGNDYFISITSPSGKVYLRNSPKVLKLDGICTFTFKGQDETGMWTISVRDDSTGGTRQTISTTVVSQISNNYPIVAQAYWGQREIKVVPRQPVIQSIYTSVSQGYHSVLGARVKAIVDSPNEKNMEVTLEDNGSGADVHANDGIYSGYFTRFKDNGRYIVKVTVTATVGTVVSSVRVLGARPPTRDQQTYPDVPTNVSTNLRCESSGGSFTLSDYNPPAGKVYTPGRVSDLRVGTVDLVARTIQLLWTAPGAELDKGRLSLYEIRYSNDFKAMMDNFAGQTLVTQSMLVQGKLSNPSSPKAQEDFIIKIPGSGNITYVFRLLSKDLNGRTSQSQPSNMVSVGMMPYVPRRPPGSNPTAIILIAVFGGLLLIVIVIIAVIGIRRVHLRRKTQPKTSVHHSVKTKPTGKVRPMSRAPAVHRDDVEPYPVSKLNVIDVRELKPGEVVEIMAMDEGFSGPYMHTCSLISID